jgi:signal transduction histidine kinase
MPSGGRGRFGRRARRKLGREEALLSSTERLRALYEISRLLTRFESIETTLPKILTVVTSTVALERAILAVERDGVGFMTVWTPEGLSPDGLDAAKSHAAATFQYLLGQAASLPAEGPEVAGNRPPPSGRRSGARRPPLVGLPLVADHQRVFGVLQLEGAVLDEMDLGFVNAVTNQLATALQRSRAEAERESLLEKEQGARADAEAANLAKDEFLAVLSHELRTPLNAITGWAHLLKRGELDQRETATAVATILRNAEMQKQLIADILDVRSIVAGELRLEMGALDLASLIETVRDTLTPAAAAKHIAVLLSLDAAPGLTPGDESRLSQVVWNLLSNAIKFSPAHGNVRIALQDVDEAHVRISVSDDGPGIPPSFLAHVFERFRQADSSTTRRHGGLGLGLAIVHSIVSLHRGTVSAANAGSGQGAVFTVTLPRLADVKREDPPSRSSEGDVESVALDGVRVLVVDDVDDDREVLAKMLEATGARVASASSAAEGLAALVREQPHVLLTDVGMPGADGYALLRLVRALPKDQGGMTSAIALTAFAGARERILDAGFQAHLVKPVGPTELARAVAGLAWPTGRRQAG